MKKLQNLFEFLKNILNNFKKNDNNIKIEQEKVSDFEDLINEVNVGDIIWAKRYQDQIEKENIPLKHRVGPFIVLDKCDEGLICCYGTSTIPKEKYMDNYYKCDIVSGLKKDTYFELNKLVIINDKTFINKLGQLDKKRINQIFSLIKNNLKHYYYQELYKKISIPLECGDIINNRNNYLIIDIEDNELKCIQISKSIGYLKNDLKFEDFKNIDFKLNTIENNKNIKYVTTVSQNTLLYVLKKYREYINYDKNKFNPQRGSIVLKNGKIYYIYGEEGQNWLVFEIFNRIEKDFDKLCIQNQIFFTNYISEQINKKEEFKTLSLATIEEIENIRKRKKLYHKLQKDDCIIEEKKEFEVGDKILIDNQVYRILTIYEKTYECIAVNNKTRIFINKKNARISNKSLEDNNEVKKYVK